MSGGTKNDKSGPIDQNRPSENGGLKRKPTLYSGASSEERIPEFKKMSEKEY